MEKDTVLMKDMKEFLLKFAEIFFHIKLEDFHVLPESNKILLI